MAAGGCPGGFVFGVARRGVGSGLGGGCCDWHFLIPWRLGLGAGDLGLGWDGGSGLARGMSLRGVNMG